MKKALKDKWVAALRSKEYKQGTEFLLSTNAKKEKCYCCLGVLACCLNFKDDEMKNKIDINSLKKDTLDGSIERKLVYMNDIDGNSFNNIANWIEKNVPCED